MRRPVSRGDNTSPAGGGGAARLRSLVLLLSGGVGGGLQFCGGDLDPFGFFASPPSRFLPKRTPTPRPTPTPNPTPTSAGPVRAFNPLPRYVSTCRFLPLLLPFPLSLALTFPLQQLQLL
ncbi:hypothetical protein DACRYDRAFT_23825 [Dacryopinax primogenitus]|uniref:Uncharacterized protein n=1 Tax=Dacryopinax primogenitus (strain DJM 731) TaxID=1858805 RepID=M5G641_DACPD|nr:uncharacterized protein DACRYDRAFT_23825 [Dacryopinax primogenitus]EJT99217.1 hypothetical protein DACRYDRAFT_23825 [Dacryopinax primogenitus]